MKLGYSFHGKLLEFPGIAVDKFNVDAEVYLLTHCHQDHLTGLSNKTFCSPIICSHITKELLLLDKQYKAKAVFLKPTPFNCPQVYIINGETIEITLIKSYHCPGSTMYLIQNDRKKILFTGDIRAEAWWRSSLSKNHHLFPFTCGLKTLDNIYLDTTFSYRGEPFIDMIPNAEGIATVIKMLQLYPHDDDDIEIHFLDHVLGFEEAWAQIIPFLKGLITHFDGKLKHRNDIMQTMDQDPNFPSSVIPRDYLGPEPLSNDPKHNLKFHICNGESCHSKPKFKVRIRQCIDFNIIDFLGSLMPINLDTVTEDEATTLTLLGETSKGYKIYQFRNRVWLLVGKELLPNELKLVFSRHSSYAESRDFIQMFKPKQVYPCTDSEETWKHGFLMSRIFASECQNKSMENFTYDFTNATTKGMPRPEILQRPIKTINRWRLNQCQEELKFVTEFMNYTSEGLEVKSGPTIEEFNENYTSKPLEATETPLQQIVTKRHDIQYNWFIQQSQLIYRRYIISQLPGQRPSNLDILQHFYRPDSQSSQSYSSTTPSNPQDSFSEHQLTEEFGCATRIPTIQDDDTDDTEIIESSFKSTEFSYYLNGNRDNIDIPTVNKISKKLKLDPDYYYSLNLQCLNHSYIQDKTNKSTTH